MTQPLLVPPFPYFGSKRAVADLIWQALGNPGVYIEPFFGSGSILLARPHPPQVETVNDLDGYLCNFFRALQHDPAGVAQWANYNVSELDLHARHRWLMAQEDFLEHMRTDPDYYDVKLAGWWVWGLCCWIGHGWCKPGYENSHTRPHVHGDHPSNGIHRKRPMVSGNTPGKGIHKKRPMVAGDRTGNGVHQGWQQRPKIQGDHITNGIAGHTDLLPWFTALAARLRRVRICCGDWQRVLTPVVLDGAGISGIVLDPPYSHQERDARLYAHDDATVAEEVRQWALTHGNNPKYNIVLCGYETLDYGMPETWHKIGWTANGGYGNQGHGQGKKNRTREVLWLSPHCQKPAQLTLGF